MLYIYKSGIVNQFYKNPFIAIRDCAIKRCNMRIFSFFIENTSSIHLCNTLWNAVFVVGCVIFRFYQAEKWGCDANRICHEAQNKIAATFQATFTIYIKISCYIFTVCIINITIFKRRNYIIIVRIYIIANNLT